MGKNQHVTPHSEGGYQVKGAGNTKATKIFETQKDAISFAKDVAKKQKSELFIHNKTGQIRERNSYGNDKFPPRG
ncbi:DUF2188 domain-containing protein [Rossellomorea vietnamensis]|uniref:DUF2188 domain-containing protein n=1 Tax=Rossellomorea vietnamensis TaxID=218284 RepID=UPI00077C51B5|nr:DUF2188 domain-containing protein [Rossellomorea vietnamensis]